MFAKSYANFIHNYLLIEALIRSVFPDYVNKPVYFLTLLSSYWYSLKTRNQKTETDTVKHPIQSDNRWNIRIYHECKGSIEKSARGSPFGITRLAE